MSGTERLNAALDGRYKIEKQLGPGRQMSGKWQSTSHIRRFDVLTSYR